MSIVEAPRGLPTGDMSGETEATVAGLRARIEELVADRDASRVRRIETITELKQIMAAIETIATTMKRLSINATIESASAGETANGFSVIASEMKSLANAAQDAVHRVHALLDARDRDRMSSER